MRSASKSKNLPLPAELARRLRESLQRERIVPRFVDSYVVEHGRYGLQVHATLYRDLLALLQRESLLAASVRALELLFTGEDEAPRGKSRASRVLSQKDEAAFRRKFLNAMTREHCWNAGDALDFQTDLHMYEELIARAASPRRSRKPFEAANHPFVDRCAFVLDSSFMEKARLAASRALGEIEDLAARIVEESQRSSAAIRRS